MARTKKTNSPSENSASTLVLEGELTIYQVAQIKPLLHEALSSSKAALAPLRLDLAAVTECDGAGLQLLLALARAAIADNARIELKKVPPDIAAIFERYGVAGHFTMVAEEVAP